MKHEVDLTFEGKKFRGSPDKVAALLEEVVSNNIKFTDEGIEVNPNAALQEYQSKIQEEELHLIIGNAMLRDIENMAHVLGRREMARRGIKPPMEALKEFLESMEAKLNGKDSTNKDDGATITEEPHRAPNPDTTD